MMANSCTLKRCLWTPAAECHFRSIRGETLTQSWLSHQGDSLSLGPLKDLDRGQRTRGDDQTHPARSLRLCVCVCVSEHTHTHVCTHTNTRTTHTWTSANMYWPGCVFSPLSLFISLMLVDAMCCTLFIASRPTVLTLYWAAAYLPGDELDQAVGKLGQPGREAGRLTEPAQAAPQLPSHLDGRPLVQTRVMGSAASSRSCGVTQKIQSQALRWHYSPDLPLLCSALATRGKRSSSLEE